MAKTRRCLTKKPFIYDIRPLNGTITLLFSFYVRFLCILHFFPSLRLRGSMVVTFTLLFHFTNYFRSFLCFVLFSLFAVTGGGNMKHRQRVQTLILQPVCFGWSWMIAYVRSAYGMICLFDTGIKCCELMSHNRMRIIVFIMKLYADLFFFSLSCRSSFLELCF